MPRITENTIWTTGDGERIKLKDLSDEHKQNIINFLSGTVDFGMGHRIRITRPRRPALISFLRHMLARKKKPKPITNIKDKITILCEKLYRQGKRR